MEWLNALLDNSDVPALTAFLLGVLTAVSPCPLATNIAAIGYIGKDVTDRRRIFRNGVLYTLGRVIAYTLLGITLISLLREGVNVFAIQKTISRWGELIIGPALFVIGSLMLVGDRMRLPSFGFIGNGEKIARKGGLGALSLGVMFAMAFCPSSGLFYFGMLIPMSVTAAAGVLFPVIFAIATAVPVLAVAWILSFSTRRIGEFYGKMQIIHKWLSVVVGIIFVAIGLYYCVMIHG